jgi:hypothetical protein
LGATVLGQGRHFAEYRGGLDSGDASAGAPADKTASPDSGTDTATHVGGATVLGKGWTAVVVMPAGSAMTSSGGELLQRLAQPTPNGRVLTSALVSVLFTDDGRVLIGSVDPAELVKVAASGKAL